MLKKRFSEFHTSSTQVKRVITFAVLDMLITVLAYTVTLTVRLLAFRPLAPGSYLFIVFAACITPIALYLTGVYQRMWEHTSGHDITVILKAVTLMTVLVLALNLLASPRPLPLSVILFSSLLMLCGFTTIRFRSRLFSGLSWRWRAIWHHEFPTLKTPLLIVGAGEAGQMLALRLKHRFPGSDYHVVGFVDDDPQKQNMFIEGCRVLGSRKDIPRLVEAHKVGLIVIAIHNIDGKDFRDILTYCEQTAARIKVIPDVLALMNAIDGQSLVRDVQLEDLVKRASTASSQPIDFSPVTGKSVLITGASGSIGSELSRQLAAYKPTTLVLLDNNESNLYELQLDLEARFPQISLVAVLADITRRDMLREVFEQYQPQVIFHAAAYKHVPMLECYPAEALRVNIGGTRNLAELACDYHVERFVLISTDKAIRPSSVMGASKRVCELILHTLSQERKPCTLFTSVRFGNVLGSRGSVIPIFARQIADGGPVTVTHPDMTRYFMSTSEAVNLVIHAACMTEGDDLFVLKMGEVVRIVDLAERMIRLRGLRPNIDIHIEFTGIRPGEKMHEELFDSSETPIQTVHPHIMKVRTWNGFDEQASTFLDKLDHLSAESNVLTQLLDLLAAPPAVYRDSLELAAK